MSKKRDAAPAKPDAEPVDRAWYRDQHPHVREAGVDPTWYYHTVGIAVGHSPNPGNASSSSTVQEDKRTARDAALDRRAPVSGGQSEGKGGQAMRTAAHARPRGLVRKIRRLFQRVLPRGNALSKPYGNSDYRLVNQSGFFDAAWYRRNYPDVERAGIDPLGHYLKNGGKELRHPSSHFDTEWYLKAFPDALESGLNPLVHFLRVGQHKGYTPLPPAGATPWWAPLVSDGTWPDGLAEFEPFSPAQAEQTVARLARANHGVAVVVPVFNAVREARACLQALLRHSPREVEIVVIDDASTDPAVAPMLSEFAGLPNVTVTCNLQNLGYTRTINRGIELAGERDVVLLNSDTEVTPGWIRRLRVAAYSDDRIATATPLSNNAGAFSAPEFGQPNPIPAWLNLADYGRAVAKGSRRAYPETPTGNGFCFYIRRDAITEIGQFDAEAFPRGYGEENDFCMRAKQAGWTHVVDDATLIYHVRSASFGAEKQTLLADGRSVVDARHPDYQAAVRAFTTGAALTTALAQVEAVQNALARQPGASVLPRALFVVSTQTGGTPQTNADLMEALQDRVEAFVLRCNARTLYLFYYRNGESTEIEARELAAELQPFPHRSAEYDAIVASWLIKYDIDLVHARHVAWHGLGLVDVAHALGVPVVFSFHDFYAVCPTVNLLDETDTFCAGTCTQGAGDCPQQLWPKESMPALKHAGVHDWKARMAATLDVCDAFVTTTPSAFRILGESFPFLHERPFRVIPHGRDFDAFHQLAAPIAADEPLRILVPGNLSPAKGSRVLAELSKYAGAVGFELHCLGRIQRDLKGKPGVIEHGWYRRENFVDRVAQIRPHVGAVLSIWAETYCHTLTELWAAGLPVVGFNIGAVGDRIEATGAGWLPAEMTAASVLETITALRESPDDHRSKIEAVRAWQAGDGARLDCRAMSHPYYDLYRDALTPRHVQGRARPTIGVLPVGASYRDGRLVGAFGSGYVRLVEKIRDHLDRDVRYDLESEQSDPEVLTQRYDALLLQRAAFPTERVDDLLAAARRHGCKLLYELDDDLIAERPGDSAADSEQRRQTVTRLLEAADLVFVSTPELKQRYAHHSARIVVEPNAISEPLWLKPLVHTRGIDVPPGLDARLPGELRVLYAGSLTHGADLELLREPLQRLRADGWRVRLFTVGITDSKADWFTSIEVPQETKPYPRFVPWLRQLMAQMDVAVAPLVDDAFNAAKSDLKFLEYAAGGLPTVASDVPAYRHTIIHGETGLLARNAADDWTDALRQLLASGDTRKALANAAYAYVLDERLVRHRQPLLDAAVQAAVAGD